MPPSKIRSSTTRIERVLLLTLSVPIAIIFFGIAIFSTVSDTIHRILRFYRVHVRPWARTRIFRQPPPRTIFTDDLLPVVFANLGQSDLARCCRVSQLCFDIAGRALYSSIDGVAVGGEKCYGWRACTCGKGGCWKGEHEGVHIVGQRPDLFPQRTLRSTFWGLLKVEFNCGSGPLSFTTHSKSQLALLERTTHLIYTTESAKHLYDVIDSTFLFPSLQTLTIQHLQHTKQWSSPFLSNLQPSHIRLIHIPTIDGPSGHAPLLHKSEVGRRAEKVTVHFACMELDGRSGNILDISWPPTVRRIDIVFQAPYDVGRSTSDKRCTPILDFTCPEPTFIMSLHVASVASDIARLLSSAAKTGASMRLVGLHEGMIDSNVAMSFRNTLEHEYTYELKREGLGDDEAEQRANELVYVALKDYGEEDDYLPF